MAMKKAVTTIDEYLRPLSVREKAALGKLRKAIHAAAPGVEECIRYGVPAFRLDGKLLVAFGVARNHCSLYPGAYPVRALGEELEGYDTSKGTVRFPAERPLPATLVKKLVRARLSQRGAGRKR